MVLHYSKDKPYNNGAWFTIKLCLCTMIKKLLLQTRLPFNILPCVYISVGFPQFIFGVLLKFETLAC